MSKLHYFLILICVSLLTACAIFKGSKVEDYHLQAPPNGVQIADNLYCDQTEISNLHWQEYMYWIQKVYGAASYEYLSAIPDTLVWFRKDTCLAGLSALYFTHPAYRDHPIVGITQFQAMKYSKWRTDRVMELILIKNGVLEWDTNQTARDHFTVFRYFTGQYKQKKPDPRFQYYPLFRLPNMQDRNLILHYEDSIDEHFCNKDHSTVQTGIIPCVNDSFRINPTQKVMEGCKTKKAVPIYQLKGNVSEWAAERFLTYGANWSKSKDCAEGDVFKTEQPNAWTGFRNVCEWKKFELMPQQP